MTRTMRGLMSTVSFFLITLLVSRQVLKPNIVIIKITTKKYRVDALILTAHYFCCSPRLTQIILVYPAISHSFLPFPSVTSWIWMLQVYIHPQLLCKLLSIVNQRVPFSLARLLSLQLNSPITKSHCRICVSIDIQYYYLCDLILSLIKFSAL